MHCEPLKEEYKKKPSNVSTGKWNDYCGMKVTYCFRPGAGEDANTAGTGIAFFIWLVSILLRAFSPLLLTNNTLSHSAILSLVCDVVRLIFSPGARKWAASNCKRCKRWITKKTPKIGPSGDNG